MCCCKGRNHLYIVCLLPSKFSFYLFRNIKHRFCLLSLMLGSSFCCLLGGLLRASFSIAFKKFRTCFMYSGYVSKLQCPPPLTHNGSYLSFASSHNRFPCDIFTISSFVPYSFITLEFIDLSSCSLLSEKK